MSEIITTSDNIIMPEILAPAGNEQCAEAAINAGANAIYLGYSSFSARAGAENFDWTALQKIVKYAHFAGVKVYLTMNTLVKETECEDFIKTLLEIWTVGVDAIIMQDILLGKFIHSQYPEIVLHLSTQAGVNNLYGAKLAREYGFSRVILARETPLEEIRKIASFMETEVFIQGALCTCFSGQCYFSSFAGGNSGNRGRCKQPCRKQYVYDRSGFEEKSYALSLSDLCVGKNIGKLREAGVHSFKIEGRMRRAEYVAAAVRYYRSLLSDSSERECAFAFSDLKRTYNRGNYTEGLAFGQDKRLLSRNVQGHIGEKIGTVKVVNGKYFVESTFLPSGGDGFKIFRSGNEVGGAVFDRSERRGFYLTSKNRLLNGDGVFITTDSKVNARVLSDKKLVPVSLSLRFVAGEQAVVVCRQTNEETKVTVLSDEVLQEAKSSPLTENELKDCFLKNSELPVQIEFENICLKGSVFIAKSCLNALRRKVYRAFFDLKSQSQNKRYAFRRIVFPELREKNPKTAVISVSPDNGVKADILIYKPDDYAQALPSDFLQLTEQIYSETYLYYPAFATEKDLAEIERRLKEGNFDGIYAENYGGIVFARTHSVKLFAGTGFNLTNKIAVGGLLKECVLSYYTVSKELDEKEQLSLSGKNAFALFSGGIKLMDLIYCPFQKSCSVCDRKNLYALTDEAGRKFPVRRYRGAEAACRFEVYNCADLSEPLQNNGGMGALIDATLPVSAERPHTSGHRKKSML